MRLAPPGSPTPTTTRVSPASTSHGIYTVGHFLLRSTILLSSQVTHSLRMVRSRLSSRILLCHRWRISSVSWCTLPRAMVHTRSICLVPTPIQTTQEHLQYGHQLSRI